VKNIVLFLLFCFYNSSHGQSLSYLNVCYGDSSKVCKRDQSKIIPISALCEIPESLDSDADDYDLIIVEVPDGFIGNLIDLIGLGPERPWTNSEIVAANEKIVCQLNTVKKQSRIDADKVKKDAKKDAWDNLCASPKAGIETLVCQEHGY